MRKNIGPAQSESSNDAFHRISVLIHRKIIPLLRKSTNVHGFGLAGFCFVPPSAAPLAAKISTTAHAVIHVPSKIPSASPPPPITEHPLCIF